MNKSNQFPRGSEWRKWDLHFHTPSSYDYQDKSVTDQEIVDTLIQNDVKVVAITDHHTMDVTRIRHLQELGAGNITFLPGIELRSELGGKESVHFIGIFPESSNLEELWESIKVRCKLQDSAISRLGDDKIYCDFCETARLFHSLGGLVSIHAGKKSNSIERIGNTHRHKMNQKTEMLSDFADILEVGQVGDVDVYRERVFPNINMTLPLIICSDNHNIRQYKLKENCWIKADPTFEGLQQTLFEPESRVRIQATNPQNNISYRVIDQVCFSSNENDFSNEPIFLNPGLNVIIGGKSTGKTLLLNCIAKTANPAGVERLFSKLRRNFEYDFEARADFNFSVTWQDGTVQTLKNENQNARYITFIPQSYIHALSETDNFKTGVQLGNIILDVILQNPEANTVYTEFEKGWKEKQREQELMIQTLFNVHLSLEQHERELLALGDREGIEAYISELQHKVEQLKSQSELSSSERETYKELNDELDQIAKDQRTLNRSKEEIELFLSECNASLQNLKDKRDSLFALIQNEQLKSALEPLSCFDTALSTIESVTNVLVTSSDTDSQSLSTIQKESSKLKERKDNILGLLTPLKEKIGLEEELSQKETQIVKEKEKLGSILEKNDDIRTCKERANSLSRDLLEHYKGIYQLYKSTVDQLNTLGGELQDIQVIGSVHFHANRFQNEFVEHHVNMRRAGQFRQIKLISSVTNTIEPNEHFTDVEAIFAGILSKKLVLKKYRKPKEAVSALLNDIFFLDWTIRYKGDLLESMSPGKANHALLALLLEHTENESPILIDQPEDDLDGRSIFHDLVDYITKRKTKRQIIMVTHNPNLVVATDAECIIVANQDGQEAGRSNAVHRFEYISGSLENSAPIDNEKKGILFQMGVRQHVCEILEGGQDAFQLREKKYGFKK